MFAGHAGLALLTRPRRAGPSLWWLVVAAFGPDWLELPFRLARLPYGHVRMLTHSLAATVVAAALFAGAYRLRTRDATGAWLVGLVWLSHWFADLLTAIKPTWPGGPSLGFALYARPGTDLALEVLVVLVGWAVYAWRHRPRGALLVGAPALLVALQLTFTHQSRLGASWKQELLQGVVDRVRARLDGGTAPPS